MNEPSVFYNENRITPPLYPLNDYRPICNQCNINKANSYWLFQELRKVYECSKCLAKAFDITNSKMEKIIMAQWEKEK